MNSWKDQLCDSRMLNRKNHQDIPDFWSASSKYGMVASAHYKATEAGVELLSKGGNAFDAAVAVSLALGVVESAGSGLGGMTMMLMHHASQNRTFALEGPCRAPVKATPEKVAVAPRKSGYKSVAVPTNPAVLEYVLNHYCTMPLKEVIAPAIRFAEEGILVTPFHYQHTVESLPGIKKGNASSFLLGPGEVPLAVGERLKQPQLSRTLSRLSDAGLKDFYCGDIAHEIIKDMQRNEGFICADDFLDVPYPKEAEPVRGQFFGLDMCSLPPPGDGTTLIQMLQVFDHLKGTDFDPDTPEAAELFARIIQVARNERRKYRLGSKSASGKTVDRTGIEYALNISGKIKTQLSPSGETSHFCVMDGSGNVVSATQSIEKSFGSKVASEALGFLYNGYMKGFKIQNTRHPHYLKPGAVARSNAAPTILFRDNRPFAAIGSTGSERMSSGIFETLVRLQYKTPFESVSAPRLHCTPEGEVLIEAERFSSETLDLLKCCGFLIKPLDAWSFSAGGLQLIIFDGENYVGVGEPRRDGAAAGPDNICG